MITLFYKMFTETFELADYVVFVAALGMSAGIGIYFGCFGTKQKTEKEYLFGSGTMKAIPVGLSLYSSAMSAITMAGYPGETYIFGSQIFICAVGMLLSLIITWYFILPVFCGNLTFTSPYEYFELRFNYKIRLLSTVIYILNNILYMPIILYASTITFSEVSQISLPICTTVVGGACIFYTMLGGFSAVIWSDTLQATLMLGSCVIVMIKGIINVGNVSEVFDRVEKGGRLNLFNMDLNPFQRLTFWSALLGMTLCYTAHSGCSAGTIQRYMALKNEKQARISSFVGAFGSFLVTTVTCSIGLTMYAKYYNCDPVKNKDVSGYNKLLSHYVAQIVKDIPGFLGFFNAGILSAGLSTISAELNTVSGLIYNCFIKRFFAKSFNENNGALIMKIIVLIIGLYYLSVTPILDKFEHITGFALGIYGITIGAKLAIMILATTFRKSNSTGIIWGSLISIIIIGWINFGALHYNVNALYVLPLSTENCTIANNLTNIIYTTNIPELSETIEVPFIYKLSYMYYSLFGALITVIIALLISYLMEGIDENAIDENLLIPWVRRKPEPDHAEEQMNMLTQCKV